VSPMRPILWGVLNITPDSFSDGGLFTDLDTALAHADQMAATGAAIIDVGGESTRPGAPRVDPAEEVRRVIPAVEALLERGHTVSVDTMNASTAARALSAGAHIINDVSGGLADPDMFQVVAESDADYVMMHWRGHSSTMDTLANYDDVVSEVRAELHERSGAARSAGIAPERIILDPGLGFAKKSDHNWAVLAGLESLSSLGHRILVGASRKRFLGELLPEGHDVTERDALSASLGVALADRGVWGLRVHNTLVHTQALDVWQAVREGRQP
jgi:dihydropteroate synthase